MEIRKGLPNGVGDKSRRRLVRRCVWLAAAVLPQPSLAEGELAACMKKPTDAEQLVCFRKLAAQEQAPKALAPPSVNAKAPADDKKKAAKSKPKPGLLADWNLNTDEPLGLSIQPYRLNYLLLANQTNSRNQLPSSAAPGHTVASPFDWNQNEIKFQFSIKSEMWRADGFDLAGFDKFRLWFAYTQQSNWQAYNWAKSSPFRENNYEPELIGTFGKKFGNKDDETSAFKLLNIGFNHQSNGRSDPESRSWWRVYGQGGWEWDNLAPVGRVSLLGRVWWRVREKVENDDNPDIKSYIGRGDILAQWHPNERHILTLLYRNSLSLGSNRGFAQLDWSTPILKKGPTRLHLQYTSGYGESLIDYNHRQQTFGVGVSFDTER